MKPFTLIASASLVAITCTKEKISRSLGSALAPQSGDGPGMSHGAEQIIENSLIYLIKASLLRAKLVYRLLPGELIETDFQEVVLDRTNDALDFSSINQG